MQYGVPKREIPTYLGRQAGRQLTLLLSSYLVLRVNLLVGTYVGTSNDRRCTGCMRNVCTCHSMWQVVGRYRRGSPPFPFPICQVALLITADPSECGWPVRAVLVLERPYLHLAAPFQERCSPGPLVVDAVDATSQGLSPHNRKLCKSRGEPWGGEPQNSGCI